MRTFKFTMTETMTEQLEALRADLGLTDDDELVNLALSLLEWTVRARKRGRIIAAIDLTANVYAELRVKALEKVQPQPKLTKLKRKRS